MLTVENVKSVFESPDVLIEWKDKWKMYFLNSGTEKGNEFVKKIFGITSKYGKSVPKSSLNHYVHLVGVSGLTLSIIEKN